MKVRREGWIVEMARKRIDDREWKKMSEELRDEILTQRIIIKHKAKDICERCKKNKKYYGLNICIECWKMHMDKEIEKYLKEEGK